MLVACAGALALFSTVVIVYVYVRSKRRLAALLNTDWNVHADDLTWPKPKASSFGRRARSVNGSVYADSFVDVNSSRSTLAINSTEQFSPAEQQQLQMALYKVNLNVFVKPVHLQTDDSQASRTMLRKAATTVVVASLPKTSLKELRAMKDADHDNVNRFVGIVTNLPEHFANHSDVAMLAVTGCCSKGTVASVLYGNANSNLPLDTLFKFGFINDIANGLNYLHNVSALKWHGRLPSANVVLDGRWTAKLTNFGFWSFGNTCCTNRWLLTGGKARQMSKKLLWVAPEVLADANVVLDKTDSALARDEKCRQLADIYSVAIVLSEILYHQPPYRNSVGEFVNNLTIADIISTVSADASTLLGPEHSPMQLGSAREVHQLMLYCWQAEPNARPSAR